MGRGHMIADAVAIIGTMDIVFGKSTDDFRIQTAKALRPRSRQSTQRTRSSLP